MAKVVQFILSETHRGAGKEGDPFRLIPQLWTLDGELVAEHDKWAETSFAHLDMTMTQTKTGTCNG